MSAQKEPPGGLNRASVPIIQQALLSIYTVRAIGKVQKKVTAESVLASSSSRTQREREERDTPESIK